MPLQEKPASQARFIFLAFLAAYLLSYFYRSANAIIVPDLKADLGLSPAELGLANSLFFAAFALAQIPIGLALDRWGSGRVTPLLLLFAASGSLAMALSQGFFHLALSRSLLGLGMAGVLMGAVKEFRLLYPPQVLTQRTGQFVGLGSLGAAAAGTPLAWLVQEIGWRLAFAWAVPLVLAVAALVYWRCLHSKAERTARPEPAISAVEKSRRSLLRDPRLWSLGFLGFFFSGSLLGFQGLWAGSLIYKRFAVDSVTAGNILLTLHLATSVGFAVSGLVAKYLNAVRAFIVLALSFACAHFLIAFSTSIPPFIAGYILFGLAGGGSILALTLAQNLVPPSISGFSTTIINGFAIGGSFCLQWIFGIIVDWPLAQGFFPAPDSSHISALLASASALALALAVFSLFHRHNQSLPSSPQTLYLA